MAKVSNFNNKAILIGIVLFVVVVITVVLSVVLTRSNTNKANSIVENPTTTGSLAEYNKEQRTGIRTGGIIGLVLFICVVVAFVIYYLMKHFIYDCQNMGIGGNNNYNRCI